MLAPDDLSHVRAILDWEMATIGDPLMDFGTTLGYWVDADDTEEWQRYGFGLTMLPGSFTRSQVVEYYAKLIHLSAQDCRCPASDEWSRMVSAS